MSVATSWDQIPNTLKVRINQLLLLKEMSPCPRGKFAAILWDQERNLVLADAFNGNPRKVSWALCSPKGCERDIKKIPSGTQSQWGCYHAEQNLILNCAAHGIRMEGKTLVVNGQPCLMCSKMIYHSLVKHLIILGDFYPPGEEGISFLRSLAPFGPTILVVKGVPKGGEAPRG